MMATSRWILLALGCACGGGSGGTNDSPATESSTADTGSATTTQPGTDGPMTTPTPTKCDGDGVMCVGDDSCGSWSTHARTIRSVRATWTAFQPVPPKMRRAETAAPFTSRMDMIRPGSRTTASCATPARTVARRTAATSVGALGRRLTATRSLTAVGVSSARWARRASPAVAWLQARLGRGPVRFV